MPTPCPRLLLGLLAALTLPVLAAPTFAITAVDTPPAPAPARTAAVTAAAPLQPGMTPAELIERLGQPVSIKPYATEPVRAEQWIYRRQLATRTVQDGTAVSNPPANSWCSGRADPVYTEAAPSIGHPKTVITYQVTELLVCAGRLVAGKQYAQVEERIAR